MRRNFSSDAISTNHGKIVVEGTKKRKNFMSKRKRTEQTEVIEEPKVIETKKRKSQNGGSTIPQVSKFGQKFEVKDTVTTIAPKPEGIRIVVGSYEKVLCGINTKFDAQSIEKVCLSPVHG